MAGVSTGTVDRIIHSRGQVSQENIDKVNAIIKSSGYKKNIFASNLAFKKKFKFGVFIPKASGLDYWEMPIKGIHKAETELLNYGVQLVYFYYPFTLEGFQKAAQTVLDADIDGLLFAPIFFESSKLFLTNCQQKGWPVIMIDSQLEGFNQAYIGQNAFQSGFLAGKLASIGLAPSSKIMIVKIARDIDSTSTFQQRTRGFYDYFSQLKNANQFELIETIIRDEDNAFNISEFSDVSSLFVPNSRAYLVAEAIQKSGNLPIRLVGFDLLPQNLAYLKSGNIDFLINQKPEEQGYQGIQYLYKTVVLKESVTSLQFMPLDIIVSENCAFTQF